MKHTYAILAGVIAALLYIIGVYLSGWTPHRGSSLTIVYIIGLTLVASAVVWGMIADAVHRGE